MDNINTREMVLDMLLVVEREHEPCHVLLKNVLDKYNYIDEANKAFIKRLFEGTLERKITIDYVINKFSKTPVNKMKPLIRCLIRMTVYQIMYMDRVPDSAAINEAVKLAKKRKFDKLSGFVNGVLRNISRQKDSAIDTDDMSVVYSCPQVIVDILKRDHGNECPAILDAVLKERHLFVRVREDIEEKAKQQIFDEWDQKGVVYRQSDMLSYAYELENTGSLSDMRCFQDGLYTVQDVSSMLVCEYADIKPGARVRDICAAPGGKSMHAANKGAVVESFDISDKKCEIIEQNAARLGIELNPKVWDATVLDENEVEQYDIVLADVPCSGIGIMGKKPDIKYGITEESLESLYILQKSIIDNAVKYVKKGGTLMYSTCTLNSKENEKNVSYICDNYGYKCEMMKTLLPCDEHDGFFISRLIRQ